VIQAIAAKESHPSEQRSESKIHVDLYSLNYRALGSLSLPSFL